MAAGAYFGVRFVVGYVGVALHARRAIGAYLCPVDVVAGTAFEVTLACWVTWSAVEAGQLVHLMASRAAGLRGYRASMRLVARQALAMPFWALGQLLFMTARAGSQSGGLVDSPLVTGLAAGMPEVRAGQPTMRLEAAYAQRPLP